MIGPLLIALLCGSAVVVARRRRTRSLPARALIISPRQSTVTASDGGVRSVQSAELSMPAHRLDELWTVANLENLARTYWLFLSRVTLGLIRIRYTEHDRRVVFLIRPLTLLRFDAPEYEIEADRGRVRWRIRDGLLVARTGRGSGFLSLDVQREDTGTADSSRLRIEVEVANFYPSIAAGFSMPAYMATQALVHVLVTHAFLRSLANLELAESKVKRLAELAPAEAEPPSSLVQP